MSLSDTLASLSGELPENPAGQGSGAGAEARGVHQQQQLVRPQTGGKSLHILAESGIIVSDDDDCDENNDNDDSAAEGTDCENEIDSVTKCNETISPTTPASLVEMVNKYVHLLPELFAGQPEGMYYILDEERAIFENFMSGNPQALFIYLSSNPAVLSAYFEQEKDEFGRLLDLHPSLLTAFDERRRALSQSLIKRAGVTPEKENAPQPDTRSEHSQRARANKKSAASTCKDDGYVTPVENACNSTHKGYPTPPKSVPKMSSSDSDRPLFHRKTKKPFKIVLEQIESESELQPAETPTRRPWGQKKPVTSDGHEIVAGKKWMTRVHESGKTLRKIVDDDYDYEGDGENAQEDVMSSIETQDDLDNEDIMDAEYKEEDSDDTDDYDEDDTVETDAEYEDVAADDAAVPARALVPYPAPQRLLVESRKQTANKNWRLFEEDLAIGHMLDIRDEGTITGEERFRETQRRLWSCDQVDRSWYAVKNFWNRAGRARSGFNERKNKKAPLATSQQGKNVENLRQRAQAMRNAELKRNQSDSSRDETPTPAPVKPTKAASKTPKSSSARKSVKAPSTSTIPQSAAKKGGRKAGPASSASTKKSAEVQQADMVAQIRAEMQADMQAQMQVQMQTQMAMFKETIAALTSGLGPNTGSPAVTPHASTDSNVLTKKRACPEADDLEDGEVSDRPVHKKPCTDDTSNRPRHGNHFKNNGPYSRRDMPPGYNHRSRQETQPGDRARRDYKNDHRRNNSGSSDSIRNDPATRAWQNGTRDRSQKLAPRYH